MTPIQLRKPDNLRLGFRFALPLGQLALCALILWPISGFIFHQFGLPAWMCYPPFLLQSSLSDSAFYRLTTWSHHTGTQVAAAINLPAGIVQLPYVVLSASKMEWMPPGVDSRVWRAATWPVLGMVFWWIAGRGADALRAARREILAPRISWPETIVGLLLAAGGGVFVIAFVFTAGQDRNDRMLQIVAAAACMWAMLGSLTVVARILQWRMRKASRALFPSPDVNPPSQL